MDWASSAPIQEIEFADGDVRVHLVKAKTGGPALPPSTTSATPDQAGHVVTAPLPGLLYLHPSPGAAPFITVGQRIEAGETVGVIEAMKMFNPVTSDVGGIVDALLVETGQEVAIGQPLVRLLREQGATA